MIEWLDSLNFGQIVGMTILIVAVPWLIGLFFQLIGDFKKS